MYHYSCCLLCGTKLTNSSDHLQIFQLLKNESHHLGILTCIKCKKDDEKRNLSIACKDPNHLIHMSCIRDMMQQLKDKGSNISFLSCPECNQKLDIELIKKVDTELFNLLSRNYK